MVIAVWVDEDLKVVVLEYDRVMQREAGPGLGFLKQRAFGGKYGTQEDMRRETYVNLALH